MRRLWKRSSLSWLVLILQSHAVATQKERGVRKPRGVPKSRFLEQKQQEDDPLASIFRSGKGGKGTLMLNSSAKSGKGNNIKAMRSKTISRGKGKGKGSTDWVLNTESPTLMPTNYDVLDIPSRNGKFCQSKQGMFGSDRGNTAIVVFIYQVELEPEITLGQLATELLPQLEIEMLDLMIPFIFDTFCGLFRRLMEGPRNYSGLSAMPRDYVLREGKVTSWYMDIAV